MAPQLPHRAGGASRAPSSPSSSQSQDTPQIRHSSATYATSGFAWLLSHLLTAWRETPGRSPSCS